jgi:hypothetical protein
MAINVSLFGQLVVPAYGTRGDGFSDFGFAAVICK